MLNQKIISNTTTPPYFWARIQLMESSPRPNFVKYLAILCDEIASISLQKSKKVIQKQFFHPTHELITR